MRNSTIIQKIQSVLLRPQTLLVIYIILAVFASVQQISLGTDTFALQHGAIEHDIMGQYQHLFVGRHITFYNNYVIFKYSFFHLIQGSNLYGIHPDDHWDFFKYSPTFALFMGALAYLPDIVGLSIWNLLNALAIFWAVRLLPYNAKRQCMLLLFVLIELLTSLQNTQSNGLMCGLIIAAYGCMQRQKAIWATLWLVLATYIKIYGAIGFCLFLFYPDKLKFILYALFWTVLFWVLPLTVTPLHTLIWQYHNWVDLLKADATAATGISVAGWLHSWFGVNNGKFYITAVGLLLFLLPFVRFKLYSNEVYKLLILASMLIWVIIFNHKAESNTYIIAVTGVGIWYFARPATRWRMALLWTVFIFTCMSPSDLFPPFVRKEIFEPYTVKAVPCILLWCILMVELMTVKKQEQLPPQSAVV